MTDAGEEPPEPSPHAPRGAQDQQSRARARVEFDPHAMLSLHGGSNDGGKDVLHHIGRDATRLGRLASPGPHMLLDFPRHDRLGPPGLHSPHRLGQREAPGEKLDQRAVECGDLLSQTNQILLHAAS
jgi:hypothetical protein